MQQLQMVDLKRQYEKIKPEVDKAIQSVIDSTAFIGGSAVQEFSKELATYLGVKHVIPCANGTDALQIALMALGLQPGDEVITPSFTFIATVEVVALLKLKPVFVDVDKDTFTINIESLKNAITPQTKAIIPVHLYGQCANMSEILAIAQAHNIPVIEDNAQAIGGYHQHDAQRQRTGSMGTIGCTSFFPSKNLGCYGDGGAIFTNDDTLAHTMRKICSHGSENRYYHEIVGVNSRLDTIQAAILRIKLRNLDAYCDARRNAATYYNNAFANNPNITPPFVPAYSHHVYHQYTLILENVDRNKVQEALAKRGVPSMIYYPVPCHKQEMFAALGGGNYLLPQTDYLTTRVLSLPIHTELTNEELEFITQQVNEVVNELSTS
jgi:UDP-2-acetamido-2-deoxy-ribo-hexuluronate aminotransferase